MTHRRSLLAIALLAACLHAWFIARTLLPAQDGLKFIRVAKQFQASPWSDVVRGADVHPLYPALVAATEPAVALFIAHGPDAWRIAAQLVAATASVGLLVPIYFLTCSLFDRRVAFVAAGLLAILPRMAELGHDTLADSVGLFATFLALWLGAIALKAGDWRAAIGAGLSAGAGYLARPEVILAPVAIGLTWLIGIGKANQPGRSRLEQVPALSMLLATVGLAVISYAAVKGEVSEKLSLRHGASLGPQSIAKRSVPQQASHGLNDPRWDFSPKEESDHIPVRNWRAALRRIVGKWWEELCWGFAVMTVWGLSRRRFIRELLPDREGEDAGAFEGRLLLVFSVCCRGIALTLLRLDARWWPMARLAAMGSLLAGSLMTQMNPNHISHISRWGHWAAGQWLVAHARPEEMVLDTRGWAKFISDRPGYDYWHVKQALTDSHLSYVLVGLDELGAVSPRASTLNALLAYAATPIVEFPAAPGDRDAAVRIYRFHWPGSWEGLAP